MILRQGKGLRLLGQPIKSGQESYFPLSRAFSMR